MSSDTRKKAKMIKIEPVVLRPREKKPRPGRFENKPSPIFVSRPKSDGKASIQVADCFFKWKMGHFPSKWCPDRNFDCWGTRPSDSESPRRALSRGGLRKNAESKITLAKSEENVSGAFFCVSGQTLKHGSNRFTIRSEPYCGFCPEMHWKPSTRFCSKIAPFF